MVNKSVVYINVPVGGDFHINIVNENEIIQLSCLAILEYAVLGKYEYI